jgi:hypothetical protein
VPGRASETKIDAVMDPEAEGVRGLSPSDGTDGTTLKLLLRTLLRLVAKDPGMTNPPDRHSSWLSRRFNEQSSVAFHPKKYSSSSSRMTTARSSGTLPRSSRFTAKR